jgi:hypothetical protein
MAKSHIWGRLAAVLLVLCAGVAARAEIGLVLNESVRVGAGKWTGAGHAAVYLSGVCEKSPVELRLCEPGEGGIILSNYKDFGEDRSYEWNAIGLNLYLYGVEEEADRPLYASSTVRWLLEERYRQRYLGAICTGSCATDPRANWREMVANTFLRDVYVFTVASTPAQDRELVERLNRAANVGRYSGFSFNCADFAREVLNSYFPGAARPDHINDFWMTSPKAIAKSFAHFGVRHPELGFHVVRYAQVPGEYPASEDNRKGTEQLFRSNRWRLPLAAVYPYNLLLWSCSYVTTGRFNPELELQRRPDAEAGQWLQKLRQAQHEGDRAAEKLCRQQLKASRARALGAKEEWQGYAERLRQYESEAGSLRQAQGGVSGADAGELSEYPRALVAQSWITMDSGGGMWLSARDGRSHPRVGLSASTLLAGGSDAEAGYRLALARLEAELHRKPKNRETLSFFRQDWELMERLHGRVIAGRESRHFASAQQGEPSGGRGQAR